MQYPAAPNEEAIGALEALLANPGPTIGENSQELESALASADLLKKVNANHLDLWLGRDVEPGNCTLATMSRTYEIQFPRDLAREFGKPGLSIPVSSILRWFALGQPDERETYYLSLADALDEMDQVAPAIEPRWQAQTERVRSLAEVASWIVAGKVELSEHGRGHVGGMIKDSVRKLLVDEYPRNVELMVPEDCLPGWIGSSRHYGIGMPVGSALTHLAGEMEEADPEFASTLKRVISKYYPDRELELEVRNPDGTFVLFDFDTQRSRQLEWELVRRVRPLAGSVDLRPYTTDSAYSTDENEFPYKLVRVWLGADDCDEEDWEEGCLLFCDDMIVHASIGRDIEN